MFDVETHRLHGSLPFLAPRDGGFPGRAALCLAFLCLGIAGSSASLAFESPPSVELRTRPAQLRLSHEMVSLGGQESMGLSGVSHLVNATPGTYAGLSAYGATSGGRGGFFTGGGTLGTGARFGRATLDAGLFVGGGGAAPQGGSLMLRPHLGLTYDWGGYAWGIGAAWVKFPNGTIDSKQAYLSLGIPFEILYADRKHAWKEIEGGGLGAQPAALKATWGRYHAAQSAHTTKGAAQQDFDLLGFAYLRELGGGWFAELETAGAHAGQSDGYAEVLFGGGWGMTLPAMGTQLRLSMALGGAGGGAVDTSGGGIVRAKVALHQPVGQRLGLGVALGKQISAGSFTADYLGFDLDYWLDELVRGERRRASSVYLQPWDIAFSHLSYFDAQRKQGAAQRIDLVGIKLVRPLNDTVFLTGQAYGAYAGEAGGYAVGLVGAGVQAPLSARWTASTEALVGVGGGGVDMGSGALTQFQAGLVYRLRPAWQIQLELGKVRSPSDGLDTNPINLSLVYNLARPEGRIQ